MVHLDVIYASFFAVWCDDEWVIEHDPIETETEIGRVDISGAPILTTYVALTPGDRASYPLAPWIATAFT